MWWSSLLAARLVCDVPGLGGTFEVVGARSEEVLVRRSEANERLLRLAVRDPVAPVVLANLRELLAVHVDELAAVSALLVQADRFRHHQRRFYDRVEPSLLRLKVGALARAAAARDVFLGERVLPRRAAGEHGEVFQADEDGRSHAPEEAFGVFEESFGVSKDSF